MSVTVQARIGSLITDIVRGDLSPRQAAFPLQMTIADVRRAIRRGDLPTHRSGRVRRVDAVALASQLHEQDELLAVEFIRGWCEGRFEIPTPATESEQPETLFERLDLLDRSCPQAGDRTSPPGVIGPQGGSGGEKVRKAPV